MGERNERPRKRKRGEGVRKTREREGERERERERERTHKKAKRERERGCRLCLNIQQGTNIPPSQLIPPNQRPPLAAGAMPPRLWLSFTRGEA